MPLQFSAHAFFVFVFFSLELILDFEVFVECRLVGCVLESVDPFGMWKLEY